MGHQEFWMNFFWSHCRKKFVEALFDIYEYMPLLVKDFFDALNEYARGKKLGEKLDNSF